jgi:hypothetical protein
MDAKTHVRTVAQEAPASTQEQVQRNGNGMWQKFAEPRGWAAKWDGFALAGAVQRRNANAPDS